MIRKTLGLYQIKFCAIAFKMYYGGRLLKLIVKLYKKYGAQNEKLLALLSLLCAEKNMLKKGERFIYLIYIICLIKSKENELAKEELITYSEKFQISDFNNFLPIINFINESKLFENSSLLEFHNNDNFAEFIKGKTIAIVGNGPQELGTKRGNEIDSHDIVIRFNFFDNDKYKEDYGTKTDIWVLNFESFVKLKPSMRAENVMFKLIDKTGFFDYKLVQKWQNCSKRFFYLDDTDIQVAQEVLNKKYNPTMGFCVAIKIFNILKSFDSVDFYGFSFLEDVYQPLNHYYDNISPKQVKKIQKIHCHEEESIYLKKIVQKKCFVNSEVIS